jgi:hypothetical protein
VLPEIDVINQARHTLNACLDPAGIDLIATRETESSENSNLEVYLGTNSGFEGTSFLAFLVDICVPC